MRRVRRLLLSAPDEGLRRRGAWLLEDALRTASLPGAEDSRLWLVRSLRLAPIDPRGSPGLLARRIEERLRLAGLQACPGDHPAAEQAPVVVFASGLEACSALAIRIGRGERVRGWFWPLAVPAYQPESPAPQALRALLYASFALPGGAAASAAWLQRLVEAGAVEPLLAGLSGADAEELLSLAGWPPPSRAIPLPAGPPADPLAPPPQPRQALAPAWRQLLQRWLPRWRASDPRGLWLLAMALAVRHPARIGGPSLLAEARALLQALEAAGAAQDDKRAGGASPGATAPPSDTEPAGAREGAAAPRPAAPPQGPPHSSTSAGRRPRSGGQVAAERTPAQAASPPPPGPAATGSQPAWIPPPARGGAMAEASACAGFAFLLVLLQQQGIETWLE
ncbi:MAG: hypothetical protein VKK97_11450, partial [Synechococcaceae cyanobacterium]|nr:hypothetical protein [Synechococcaceae cyanobacterium]